MRSTGSRRGSVAAAFAVGALLVGGIATAAPVGSPWSADAAWFLGTSAPVPASAVTPLPPALEPVVPAQALQAAELPASLIPGLELPDLELPDLDLPDLPIRPSEPAPPPPAQEPAPASPAAQVVDLTNAERADAGCGSLRTDARLAAAAQGHSEDMAEQGYFDHDGTDGRGFVERARAEGHPEPGGENIAAGQETAAEVVAAWMDSPGHRRNILDCDFATIGVGYDPRGHYWVQDFGY